MCYHCDMVVHFFWSRFCKGVKVRDVNHHCNSLVLFKEKSEIISESKMRRKLVTEVNFKI